MKVKIIDFGGIKPLRAHYNDAGLDCFSNENDFDLTPGSRTIAKLGFGLCLPDGYVALLLPRSSMNAKGLQVEVGTIDSGYRGEVKAVIANESSSAVKIKKGMKIAQLVIMPIAYIDLVDSLDDERKENGFGSTGK